MIVGYSQRYRLRSISQDSRALRLTSELVDLRAANVHQRLSPLARAWFKWIAISANKNTSHKDWCFCLVKIVGFEPTTSCMSSKRSDQLSYTFISSCFAIISQRNENVNTNSAFFEKNPKSNDLFTFWYLFLYKSML